MISCGRGRSRGGAKDIEVPLRRPGENALGKNNQPMYNDIIEGINNLSINETISSDQTTEIANLVNTTKDEKTLKSIFDKLYKRAVEDKIFGIKLARLFIDEKFYNMKVDEDKTMRYLMLHTLQNDYIRREEMRKDNNTLFRNVTSLLGEIYHWMAIKSGFPCFALESPLLDYWNMLLETATEEDIELVVTQVIINGKNICKRKQTEIDEFMFNVRKTLVNNNLSTLAKGMLLLLIDLANQQFNLLPENIYDYYMSHLGTTVAIYLQRHKKNFTNAKNNTDKTTKKKQQRRIPSRNNCKPTENAAVNDNKKNFSTENTVPRAIRGPGASHTERNFKNQAKRFTNSPPSQHSTKNKGWRHDDRFENDYD